MVDSKIHSPSVRMKKAMLLVKSFCFIMSQGDTKFFSQLSVMLSCLHFNLILRDTEETVMLKSIRKIIFFHDPFFFTTFSLV